MMNKKIILVGGGGHCKSVLDTLLLTNQYSEIGVVDLKEFLNKKVLSASVIGTDKDLPQLYKGGYKHAFVSLGSIGKTSRRINLYNTLEDIGFTIPNIIDPTAIISNDVQLGNGIFIGKKAVINAGATIHNGAIINTASIIEHDCIVGEFTHIAPGTVMCGNVQVGRETHIGANSVIKQQIKIGSHTMIGMGSIVLKDIGDSKEAFGSPCKEV
ncbi:acetyltransferase [Metabacillus sp. B2-18]|uniref:acetyltransferase n=1 Tax=Metabacillus sp. B2-18 TaxID=2897333 RepID=UPI001E2B8DC8|nr:acetyltransferase [Metabacillus sp. B2-18]UGB30428.1 acetyltransferase [Metabacillus sp. B2-18]